MWRAPRIEMHRRRDAKTICSGPFQCDPTVVVSSKIPPGFAIFRHEGINVNESGNTLEKPVSNAAQNHTRVAMSAKDDVLQIFEANDVCNILDMGIKIGAGTGEM